MEFGSFDEFWKARGRLYDSTVKNTDDIRKLRASIHELNQGTERVLSAVEKLHKVADAHEHPLDRAGITVEAILEDLRRHREGRSSEWPPAPRPASGIM